MRIAEIAPMYEAVPPIGYGGTERVIGALCDELVTSGHEVTLFAPGTSQTKAELASTIAEPLRTRMTRTEMLEVAPRMHLEMLAAVYEQAADFDVIHAHTDVATLRFAASSPAVPTVVTLHGRLDLDAAQREFLRYPEVPLVSISNHQREAVCGLDLNWRATVPNGLDLSPYFDAPSEDGGYLCFVGRINREKRPDLAAEVARRSGIPLRVAAKVDPTDIVYHQDIIEPLFHSHGVEFLGELLEYDKPKFYASASATIFPSDWPEPFGLVMIESLAAGTPVIALRRGSVPEILEDGVSGFICNDLDGLVAAVGRIGEIDPEDCRDAARRFSATQMADRYASVFGDLLNESRTDDVSPLGSPGIAPPCAPPEYSFSS
ncbi:MAG: glycosyltransferase family 4 protein [Acidimicrobiia bacterium]